MPHSYTLPRTASLLTAALTLLATGRALANDCAGLDAAPRVTCLLDRVDQLLDEGSLTDATPVAFDAAALAGAIDEVALTYRTHLTLGELYAAKQDHTNAMERFVAALKVANDEGDTAWVVDAKTSIGRTYAALENYELAEKQLLEGLILAQAKEMWSRAAELNATLGEVYLRLGVIGKSQASLKTAIQLFTEREDFARAADVSGLLADQYFEAGDYDNAELYAEQTLQLNSSTQDLGAIAADNQRLARVYTAFDDFQGAIEYTERAHGLYTQLGDSIGRARTFRDFALYHFERGQRWLAKVNADSAMAILATVPGSAAYDVPRDLSLLYERGGRTDDALQAQRDYLRRREAFYDGEKTRALVELTTRYESEFATEEQRRRIEILEQEEAQSRQWRLFLVVILLMLAVLVGVLYIGYRRKLAANELLTAKNEEIRRQKTEIDLKNLELEEKNDNLAGLNGKLVDEMAERESIQKTSFARDRFLATMSHEMRTPINIISGLCHLLLEERPRPDQVEHLRTLQFSANNLVVFINDILDFSKIEAGKLNLEKREFNPKRLFSEIENRFETPAREKSVEITYDFDERIPDCLMGDPARFNQIMTNLVQTSIAHSVEASVHVAVKVEELRKEETMLRFEVTDTGQVLDDKLVESMFRSFTFNPDDAFEGYNSSDLVLAITRRLVDLQNGHIEVKPRPDGGNRFTVLLRFKTASPAARRERVGAPKAFEHLAGNAILLVEDNKINQLVVQKMLSRIGIAVTTADDGVEALRILQSRTFDLVLMDIQMPKMDGYRATAEIRKHANPGVRDVPVIALTASAFLSEREKAKLFGMNDHVGKPFAPEELLEKISHCLEVHREEGAKVARRKNA